MKLDCIFVTCTWFETICPDHSSECPLLLIQIKTTFLAELIGPIFRFRRAVFHRVLNYFLFNKSKSLAF